MKIPALISLFLISAMVIFGQEKPQYAISLIPDSLRKNVNSVIREQSDVLLIRKPGKGKQTKRKVVTVFNEKAESELVFYEYYDKFRKIDDIEVSFYDENGKYLKRSRKRDLHSVSAYDGSSLVDDDKIIFSSLRTDKYPVTIEINYERIFEGILGLEPFFPQVPEQSIQHKIYSITTDTSNKIRYRNYRTDFKPKITQNANLVTYTWEVNNTQPFYLEPGSAKEDIPRVQIAPSYFEMDDYAGNMSTWDDFGKWQIMLNKNASSLPEEKIAFFRNLVKDAPTEREKIEILYRHLQENYRYVSIQLGIGGWKPFTADFVEKKKYGDCKALSNFMYAMLKAVGIRSHYAIINSDYNSMPVDKDFPQNAFNHVILCVPQAKDTIWLECTSRTQPFGKLGTFTENRNAFLITETGGVVVPTPRSQPQDNTMKSYSFVTLAEDGSGDVLIRGRYTGSFAEITNQMLESEEQSQKSYLIHTVGFKQPDQMKVSSKNKSNEEQIVEYEMFYEKIPDFSAGSKHFLNPRIYKFWNRALPKVENRKNNYYLRYPLIQTDSTVYQLPEGYIVDNLPKSSQLKFTLGSYQSDYYYDESKRQVITTCSIKIDSHIIPAKVYQEAFTFFSDVIKEQQQKIVIRKQ